MKMSFCSIFFARSVGSKVVKHWQILLSEMMGTPAWAQKREDLLIILGCKRGGKLQEVTAAAESISLLSNHRHVAIVDFLWRFVWISALHILPLFPLKLEWKRRKSRSTNYRYISTKTVQLFGGGGGGSGVKKHWEERENGSLGQEEENYRKPFGLEILANVPCFTRMHELGNFI